MVQAPIDNERDFDRVAESLIIQHPRIHLRAGNARRERAKTESSVETTQTLAGFRRKVNTLAVENLEQMPITQTSFPLKITITMTTRSNSQMLIKHTTTRVTLGVTSEKKLWTAMTTRKTTRFLQMLLWTTSLVWRQLNWTRLLFSLTHGTVILTQKSAHSWCKPMYKLTFPSERSRVKGKGQSPVRPSCLPLEDRRQRLRELKAETECRACGRKGHWAHDLECAVSPSSLSSKTQTHTARMTTTTPL